ncbi:FhaA domain-containing protein [Dactylosporangium sp. CA-139066]|uniref:FhaA domain-containing protein n=1 Tax=Dactylosporangium sp. CA-139066 TaxID=3239930 RepID=UPI003D8F0005
MSLPHRLTILDAMQREAEVGEQTLAPNSYLVLVAPEDHPHLAPLASDLARSHAGWLDEQGWQIRDAVVVDIEPDGDVPSGEVRVVADVRRARTLRGDEAGRGIGLLVADGRRYTLQAGTTVIGRGREADLRIRDEGVSRRHASLRYDGRALTLSDLGSTNGTTLNDQPVLGGPTPVAPGDTIGVGPVTLTVES